MDDATKMRVLKIYYDHWGREELRTRKAVYGMGNTLLLLVERFQTQDRTLYDGLKRMFHYLCEDDMIFLWTDFADILLQDVGGCFDALSLDELYDEDEILFDRKVILEENLNITNSETADMIYDSAFGYRDALSVDAIVALL